MRVEQGDTTSSASLPLNPQGINPDLIVPFLICYKKSEYL
jgi:hypothetical protein